MFRKQEVMEAPLFEMRGISAIEKTKVMELIKQQRKSSRIKIEIDKILEDFLVSEVDIVEIMSEGKPETVRSNFNRRIKDNNIHEIACTQRGSKVFLLRKELLEE